MPSTTRFLRHYLKPRPDAVHESETTYRRGEDMLDAAVYRPAEASGQLPGWVVLHGLTARGRRHPNLVHLARSMAASGALVLVPEIPEWSRLEVAPDITVPTIRDAVLALGAIEDVAHGRTAVLGFSFGATQALVASVDPALEGRLRGVAAWGAYCDLHAAFRCAVVGEHEWDAVRYHTEPDPYGRWVMGANYLTAIAGFAEHRDVAHALHELALEAGESGVGAWDRRFDASKARHRRALPTAPKRELFDLFAPATDRAVDRDRALALARSLAEAALEKDPLLDPKPHLPRVRVRTLLAHGRYDRLVPFTSMYCLRELLPKDTVVRAETTALFAHSGGDAPKLGLIGRARETWRFLTILNGILRLA